MAGVLAIVVASALLSEPASAHRKASLPPASHGPSLHRDAAHRTSVGRHEARSRDGRQHLVRHVGSPATVGRRAVREAPAPDRLRSVAWDGSAVPPRIIDAVRATAQARNVSATLLMAMMWRESRFDPLSRSRSSSAFGLTQFTTATWLEAIRDFGAQHGLDRYAAAIGRDADGHPMVHDRAMRRAILGLRGDPELAIAMAGDVIAQRRDLIARRFSRTATAADIYLSYALGATGGERLLSTVAARPATSSEAVIGRTALRNAGLLAPGGRALTVARLYTSVDAILGADQQRFGPLLADLGGTPQAGEPIEVAEYHVVAAPPPSTGK